MNYSALIQNRKSVREFTDQQVFFADLEKIRRYYETSARRLVPQLKTKLHIFGTDVREALEGAAGYNRYLVGAPQYLVLLSEKHELAHMNGGFLMEDLILKLTEMNLDTCWVTFVSSDGVKEALALDSEMDVVAIAAFGYGRKTTKRLRLNIRSMSDVDIVAKHRYMEPKRSISDLAFLNTWGNTHNLLDYIGFYDEMLWEALYAASLSPSYLNRQAYGFLLRDGGEVSLIRRPDAYTPVGDADLSLGIALLHFSAVAEHWAGELHWHFGEDAAKPSLPEGHRVAATCRL